MTLDKMLYGALLAVLLLPACVVAPGHRDPEVAPALPVVVELNMEPYYFHSGFYYYFHDHDWSYSRARTGPWKALPRDRYPREVRFRDHRESGRDHERDRDDNRDRHRDDDHDRDYRR